MAAEQHDVTIEITCTQPPVEALAGRGPVYLGLQKDKDLVDAEPLNAKRLVFRPVLEARKEGDGTASFHGPFAHGPRNERFIYLVWAIQERGKPTQVFGRIKLHLNHIGWEDIENAGARKKTLRVTLPLTKAKGKPVLASVRPDAARWSL